MRFFRRRAAIFAVVTLFFLLFSKGTAHAAGIDSSLKDMFNSFGSMTSATSAGAYKGQTRGYLTGGSISIRNPNKTYQLLTYDSPKFEAGCGGLDLYLGSFSYIDADKFEQLIKNIGSAALGYTVQLAIGVLCQQCKATLNEIDGIMRKINAMSANSCAAAKALVDGMGAAAKVGTFGESIKSLSTSKGNSTDASEANKTASEPGGMKKLLDAVDSALPEIEKPYGNITYDGISDLGLSQDEVNLILSVTGAIVWTKEGVQRHYPSILTANDLYHGGAQLETYQCSGSDCLTLNIVKKDIQGFSQMAFQKLDSIADSMQAGSAISATDQSFIDASDVPIYSLLSAVNEPSGTVRKMIISNASNTIALLFTIGWLDYATKQTLLASSQLKKGTPSSSMEVLEMAFKAEQSNGNLLRLLNDEQNKMESYKSIITLFADTFNSEHGALNGNLAFGEK